MAEEKLIRIVITDDHKIIREGLRSLLERDSALSVVGEAANGRELLELRANPYQSGRFRYWHLLQKASPTPT